MTASITEDEASTLTVDPAMRKLLTPQEVSRLGALPLAEGPAGDSFTLAVDAGAPANAELLLRMRLGVRRIELRQATRQAMQLILEAHFLPYWAEKGWTFAGLPELSADPRPSAPAAAQAVKGKEKVKEDVAADHPSVLLLESAEGMRKALGEVLLGAGYEPRFAATLEEAERELQRAAPSMVVARQEGPVPIDRLVPLVRKAGGAVELRVLRDYAGALLGSAGDERFSGFLFDLVRFFIGILSPTEGTRLQRSESRARAAELAARRMGLPPLQVETARIAVLFGDLEALLPRLAGEPARDRGARVAGPGELAQLLDPLRTPFPIASALEEREERFDGSGPHRLVGEAIPPAARVLAAVDAYFEVKDAGAPGSEIESRLRHEAGKRLDPRAIEAVLRAERAEQLVDRLGSAEDRVLLVDPDPVSASLLEMRLANSGLEVEVHRNGESALAAAIERRPDLVISEVAVPGLDGFSLLLRLRKTEAMGDIPFIFLTERTDRSSSVRGLDLGADDFIPKPADLELVAAKVKGMIRKARARRPSQTAGGGGVSGSLADMGLVDLLQVLAASRRCVRVRVEDGRGGVAEVALDKGRLIDARKGDQGGQEVFYDLLTWKEGRFAVRAEAPAAHPAMDIPLEMLLLEACRRGDEAGRPA